MTDKEFRKLIKDTKQALDVLADLYDLPSPNAGALNYKLEYVEEDLKLIRERVLSKIESLQK